MFLMDYLKILGTSLGCRRLVLSFYNDIPCERTTIAQGPKGDTGTFVVQRTTK